MLVNENPTSFLYICKGLRQGGPLSPYLFVSRDEEDKTDLMDAKKGKFSVKSFNNFPSRKEQKSSL